MNNTSNDRNCVSTNNLSSRKLWQLLDTPTPYQLSPIDIQAIEAELAKRNQLNRRWHNPH